MAELGGNHAKQAWPQLQMFSIVGAMPVHKSGSPEIAVSPSTFAGMVPVVGSLRTPARVNAVH
jgi:hypothetical protein